MTPVVVYENELITVEYLPDHHTIQHIVHQPICGQPLYEALIAGSDALARYGVCKWLSDDRKNGPLLPEDVEWGSSFWHPHTIRAGWKYWALVVPEQIVSAGSMMPTIQSLYELGLRVSVFATMDEALEWLDQQPNY